MQMLLNTFAYVYMLWKIQIIVMLMSFVPVSMSVWSFLFYAIIHITVYYADNY